jgi:hypothetical protein
MKENRAMAEPKNSWLHTLLRDQRVLFGISILLAAVVWLVLAVINGEERVSTIAGVPVRVDFTGTVAEELGLIPFSSGPLTDPDNLTVTVVVRCKRYENVTAETLNAVLVTENVFTAGEQSLSIRVSPKNADKEHFVIVSCTPASLPLYFDHERTLEFKLTPEVIGEVRVDEGYHAEDALLSKNSVSVYGPATLVNAIAAVKAEISPEGPYSETAVFRNIRVTPVDRGGNTSPYLVVEGGDPQVNATLPVWKRASLYPAVDFQNVPGAYLSAPLPVTVTPAAVRAALPEDRIAEDLRYSVGLIDFQALSPASNRFSFPAEDLREIRLFDETQAFTAVVDLAGFDTQRFTLPGAQVQAPAGGGPAARFDDINNVVVVGPAQAVAALTPFDLAGEAEIPADARPGRVTLPVAIRVKNREDCWVYGEYAAKATLTEE